MAFPTGHFYSPVIDPEELRQRQNHIWPHPPKPMPGVDFNPSGQRALLHQLQPYVADFNYGTESEKTTPHCFFEPNGRFESLDSRMLFCLIRLYKPQRIIEVGSGLSSLLMADANIRFSNDKIDLTCIEPYPPAYLQSSIPGIQRVLPQKVQKVDINEFKSLQSNDILFIDSSHVSKTGSDVNFLYFEVLPTLAAGVIIHIHDIFFPHDYPPEWVIEEERSWNEQYILHALLLFSSTFEVLFGSAFAHEHFPELVSEVFGKTVSGGSFWMRKKG